MGHPMSDTAALARDLEALADALAAEGLALVDLLLAHPEARDALFGDAPAPIRQWAAAWLLGLAYVEAEFGWTTSQGVDQLYDAIIETYHRLQDRAPTVRTWLQQHPEFWHRLDLLALRDRL
jgi:hypothetical protein